MLGANAIMQVAETFSFVDERDGSALIDHAFLDTMVRDCMLQPPSHIITAHTLHWENPRLVTPATRLP